MNSITQIINAFPDECRELIPRVNYQLKKELKPYLVHCKSIRNRYYDDFNEWFLLEVIKGFYKPDKIEKQIKRNISILRIINTPKDNTQITDDMIQQAREVPIVKLYDFQKIKSGHTRFNACCPFHNEKTGSFFIYPNNTFYCFGACKKGGDSIEFICQLHEFSFIEAVRYLLKY